MCHVVVNTNRIMNRDVVMCVTRPLVFSLSTPTFVDVLSPVGLQSESTVFWISYKAAAAVMAARDRGWGRQKRNIGY